MYKILVLFTGGTIGSAAQSNAIDVSPTSSEVLLSRYEREFGCDAEFELLQPLNLLSENSTPDTLNSLCQALSRIDFHGYKGVILTHGSDTLSYTSALLGLLFAGVPVPVVITAANYPLEDPRSNGLVNFKSAVDFILSTQLKGVYTIYQNCRGEALVYLSTRLMEADPYEGEFRSFGGPPLGMMLNGRFQWNPAQENPAPSDLARGREPVLSPPRELSNQVLFLRPYPGLDYSRIPLEPPVSAVLQYLYHSSTGCTQPERYSLAAFIERCSGQGIPVYLASFQRRESYYSTSLQLLEAGGLPLYNISPEAAYAKLLLAYNQTELPAQEYLSKDIFYETLPEPGAGFGL